MFTFFFDINYEPIKKRITTQQKPQSFAKTIPFIKEETEVFHNIG